MKQFFFAALLLQLSFLQQAVAQLPKNELCLIEGMVKRDMVQQLKLYSVHEGSFIEMATVKPQTNGQFAFAIPQPTEGFYYIGDCLGMKEVKTRIYLKSGTRIQISLENDGYSMTSNSPENQVLDKWQQQSYSIMKPAYQFWTDREGYTSFFPALTAFVPAMEAFKKTINTPNKYFNSLMRFTVQDDLEAAAANYLFTPRTKHPTREEWPVFYASIPKEKKYCDQSILRLGDGTRRVGMYASLVNKLSANPPATGREIIEAGINGLCNDTVKGVFLINNLTWFRNFEELQKGIAPYTDYIATDSLQAKLGRYQRGLASFAKGEKGYNFSFTDTRDSVVTLASLKGKVVLVDMWATWCGPCRKEFPALKQLEEEFKGKDVAFVSISTDQTKDKEKWKKMIADEQLGGIQLFAGGPQNNMSAYYNVNAIPRFMVFDGSGKIVSANSPRPSEPELKELLLETLKSNGE